ncbi:MAG TPA: PAS domain S-box protein [Gemmataceae bacterium]|nr:PAS domain S-box protein [Gemmataceae bacterium]
MKFDYVDGMAQALFEETGDALFLFDPETDQILDANSTAQRLTGLSVSKLSQMVVPDLFYSPGEEGLDNIHKAARKTTISNSMEGYFLHTLREGVRIPVNITIARLHVKPKTVGLITARDVRKQHTAYAKLQKIETELRQALSLIADCIWSGEVDQAGNWSYHFFSPVVEKIARHPADFFLPGINRWWSIVHPEDQARWTKALARQRAGQSTQEEYRIMWPDGTCRRVRESVQAVRGIGASGPIHLYGVIADITDGGIGTDVTGKKQAEEKPDPK